ncbi:putative CDP-diacylglycerol--glycerol-3-phosphate 3-phosphatidyl-transferase 2 [Platysternon megacephalum]|uniref:cardiolipin synthase (CMP-forming) n=1 Tax=Platysternon megacephalum TaxID=55544 RepID=A0A4D9DJ04_9SAUR|nr:putative CDP-diacylglycerol--glycerol-3-phosphate 3-phosphatidyl-transferase 2 [Platysternon megacephalum]
MLRIAFVPLFGWMLLAHPHEFGWRIATTLVFCLAIATDLADGKIARKYNLVTDFGKLADPIADKALTGMAFIGLSILGELWWWVTIVILVREWGITLLRERMRPYGVMAANKGGKAKTVMQAVALIAMLLPLTGWWRYPGWFFMAAALVLTVVTGVVYIVEARRLKSAATGHQRGSKS